MADKRQKVRRAKARRAARQLDDKEEDEFSEEEWAEITRRTDEEYDQDQRAERRKLQELADLIPGPATIDPKDKIWRHLIAEYGFGPETLYPMTPSMLALYIEARQPGKPASEAARPVARPAPSREPVAPITIEGNRVLVAGNVLALDFTQERMQDILHFLRQLIANCGQWVSGPDISKAAAARYPNRYPWDRLQKSLPSVITDHIETDRRKGKRLIPL